MENEPQEKSWKMLFGKSECVLCTLGTFRYFHTALFILSIFSIYEDAPTDKISYINDHSCSFKLFMPEDKN